MAEPIVRSFVIDTTESEQNLKELNVQINATSTAVNTSAESLDNVAKAEDAVATSSKSLKAQLRDLQQQLAATDPKSDKYVELSQRAGELKDAIGDAAEAVGTQAGSAFERLGNSAGLLTGRLANLDFAGAAEGAKLFAQNISSIKFSDITSGIKSLGGTLASVGKALLTNPIFLIGATLAVAISYTSQFIAGLDGISEADERAFQVQKDRANLAKEQVDLIGAQEESLKRQGLTEKQILDLKLQALDTAILEQEVVVQTAKTQAQAQIEAAERNYNYLKSFLDFVTLPQRKLTEFFLNFYNGAVDLLNKLPGVAIEKVDVSKVTQTFDDVNKFLAEKLFNPEETKKEAQATIKEAERAYTSLKNQRDGLINAQAAKEKAAREKAAADAKAAADKLIAEEKARLDKQYAAQKDYYDKVAALQDEAYENTLTKEEQEELAIVQKYEAAFAAADAAGQSTIQLQQQLNAELAALDAQRTANAQAEADKRKSAEDDFFADLQALNQEKFAAEDEAFAASLSKGEQEELRVTQRYERLFAKADAAGKSTVDLQKRLAVELKKIQDDSANQELATKQITAEKGLQLAQGALQVLQAFSDNANKKGEADARKQFKRNKALAIGTATVQTAQAVSGALTAGGNPVKLATGAQFVEAAIAGALGLAQIIKIKNSQFGGGGSGGNDTTTSVPSTGGADTGGGAAIAQFNPLAASFLQDRPEQLTPRAYVLAGDVASQQEVREKVEDLSRIG